MNTDKAEKTKFYVFRGEHFIFLISVISGEVQFWAKLQRSSGLPISAIPRVHCDYSAFRLPII
jgi:hypothetical protein